MVVPLAGVPIVYRTATQRAENSERLNLDRVNLTIMPLLEGEHRLRLLNYQNNLLTRICHLQGLPNLIFLDLYNNHIERIEGKTHTHTRKGTRAEDLKTFHLFLFFFIKLFNFLLSF